MSTDTTTPNETPNGKPNDSPDGTPAGGRALVLAGGQVFDPGRGIDMIGDIVIVDGRIASIGCGTRPRGAEILDCSGSYVTPGLIDFHSHVFAHVSKVGAPVDEAHLQRGVVAVCDAGTAGASTFAAFKRYVADPSRVRVLSFLNVSVLGLIDFRFGELLNPDTLVPADCVSVAAENGSIVKGLKIRLSTDVVADKCLELLHAAIEVGNTASLPLMVHIGETEASLPEILAVLRSGDIVAHCYTGKDNGILEGGRIIDAVWGARERGVQFDCAHGKSNFSYEVAEVAIAEGFLPDFVCSDTSYRNWNGPVFDLLTTMSKLETLGMSLADIVHRTTVAPAAKLGIASEGYGSLAVGDVAHVSVFSRSSDPEEVPDASGKSMEVWRLDPQRAIIGSDVVESLPWRGTSPSTS